MTGNRSPEELLASRLWRFTNSLWLLLSILGLGFLTWLGFLIHGFRAKKLSWIVSGIAWLVVPIVCIYVSNQAVAHTRINPTDNGLSGVSGALIIFSWLGGIIHSCLTNKNWLFWKAHLVDKNQAVFDPELENPRGPEAEAAKEIPELPEKPGKAPKVTRAPEVNDTARSASDSDSTTFVFNPAQKPTPAIRPTETND